MGLDDELEARVGLGRSDYSQADHFARRAASGELSDFEHRWGASSNLFFDTYRPQVYRRFEKSGESYSRHLARMDEEESLEVMKMLAMPAARELQVAFLEHLASFESAFANPDPAVLDDSQPTWLKNAAILSAAFISAARACALKQFSNYYSEDVIDCLKRARDLCNQVWREGRASPDRTWFYTVAGRLESLLDELKIATESICFELVWQPLRDAALELPREISELASSPNMTASCTRGVTPTRS